MSVLKKMPDYHYHSYKRLDTSPTYMHTFKVTGLGTSVPCYAYIVFWP